MGCSLGQRKTLTVLPLHDEVIQVFAPEILLALAVELIEFGLLGLELLLQALKALMCK